MSAGSDQVRPVDIPDPTPPSSYEGTEDRKDAGQRDAFFIGLGDAVIPTVLIASAANFSPATGISHSIITGNLPAFGGMAGTVIGLLVLLQFVMRGRPHAGLPLLNGGAIGGYLVGSAIAGVPLLQALGVAGIS